MKIADAKPGQIQAVAVTNPSGTSPVVLVCEHASKAIPEMFDGLGLDPVTAESHAAWDIGAHDLAQGLSERLDAPLVAGCVSRLVYDCNRPPDAHDAIPAKSELFDIPGNAGLDDLARAQRAAQIHRPFHDAVGKILADHAEPRVLVTVHSFTPVFFGRPRSVQLGFLHGTDARLAQAMLAQSGDTGWICALNAPYGPQDGVLHTLDLHATPQGILNVMIEVRNDLISDPAGVSRAVNTLSSLLDRALAQFDPAYGTGR